MTSSTTRTHTLYINTPVLTALRGAGGKAFMAARAGERHRRERPAAGGRRCALPGGVGRRWSASLEHILWRAIPMGRNGRRAAHMAYGINKAHL